MRTRRLEGAPWTPGPPGREAPLLGWGTAAAAPSHHVTRGSGRGHSPGTVRTRVHHYFLSPRRVCLSDVTCSLTTTPPPVGGGPAGSDRCWRLTGVPGGSGRRKGQARTVPAVASAVWPSTAHLPAVGFASALFLRNASRTALGRTCISPSERIPRCRQRPGRTAGLSSGHLAPLPTGGPSPVRPVSWIRSAGAHTLRQVTGPRLRGRQGSTSRREAGTSGCCPPTCKSALSRALAPPAPLGAPSGPQGMGGQMETASETAAKPPRAPSPDLRTELMRGVSEGRPHGKSPGVVKPKT